MPRLVTDGNAPSRFESDAESLHFPEGGVFGPPAPTPRRPARSLPRFKFASSPSPIAHSADTQDVLDTIRRIQRQMDTLPDALEDVLSLPNTDSWPPRAA